MAINEQLDTYLRDLYERSVNPPEVMPGGEVVPEVDDIPLVSLATGREIPREATPADVAAMEAEGYRAKRAAQAEMAPESYLNALRAAQRQDELAAMAARTVAPAEEIARIQSRGLYRPSGVPVLPSAAEQLTQRQKAVQEMVAARRADERAAVDAEYKRALAARMAEPRLIGKTQEELSLISARAETERARQEELAARAARARAQSSAKPGRPSAAPTKEERITTGLRREFEAQPVVKSFSDVQAAFGKVSEASKGGSPATDLSMLYNYAKLLDPGSVVRESEFQTMAQTGAFGDKVAAAVKRVSVGERLTDAQRADFVKAAKQQFNVYGKQFDETAARYEGLAKKSGVSPEDVVFRRKAFTEAEPTSQVGQSVRVRRKSDGKVVEVPSTSVESLTKAGAVEVIP